MVNKAHIQNPCVPLTIWAVYRKDTQSSLTPKKLNIFKVTTQPKISIIMKSSKFNGSPFNKIVSLGFIIILATFFIVSCNSREKSVLVYSKTLGFRHGVIESATTAIEKLGKENGFTVTATEDPRYFVEDSLQNYATVIFLNTTRFYLFKLNLRLYHLRT